MPENPALAWRARAHGLRLRGNAGCEMSRAVRKLAQRLEEIQPQGSYVDALKSRLNPRVTGLVGLEQEILREAALSLGRQGQRLERALAALRKLEREFVRAPSEALLVAHQAERREAERLLYYLKIQREALGLRNHRELERRYAVPAPLRPRR